MNTYTVVGVAGRPTGVRDYIKEVDEWWGGFYTDTISFTIMTHGTRTVHVLTNGGV